MTFHFYVVFEIVKHIYTAARSMKTVVQKPLPSHQQPPLELTAHRCIQQKTEVALHKYNAAKNTKAAYFHQSTSLYLPPDLRQSNLYPR